MVEFKHAIYLNSLLSDGRVGVCEAVDNMRENLGVDCCLIQILNELLHLGQRGEIRDTSSFLKCFTLLPLELQIVLVGWYKGSTRQEARTCCSSRILMALSVEENIFTITGMIFCWYSSADRNFPTWERDRRGRPFLSEKK